MLLTFRVGTGSPPLAVVTAYQELCGQVNLVIEGKTMPPLTGADALIQRVMAIVGFRWPDYPAPGPTGTAAP
ncbi:MAG TPA: hypothetical protein VF070_00305 [Streptosporangiaceae bacterium]